MTNEPSVQSESTNSEEQPQPRADAALLGKRREAIQRHTGQLALAMARTKRYGRLNLADLDLVVVQPLLSNRVVFFQDQNAEVPTGIAIWASVSPEVSTRIAAEREGGTVPIRLASSEWTSGSENWLLDILAPDRRAGSAVFRAFAQVVQGQPFRMHPVVLNALDADLVEKLRSSVQDLKGTREQPSPD